MDKHDIDLGYIYESYYPAHWMMHSTILSIAQLSFLTPDDLFFVQTSVQEEVCPEITVEKLGLLSICFYAISTEYRFLERKDDFIANIGKKIPPLKCSVPESEVYLGRAVEVAYSFLHHEMPFVLQIFNVFRRFQAQINVAIPEDTEVIERWIYVTPYKGGFHNKSIIPLVRRNNNKKNFCCEIIIVTTIFYN